MAARVNPDPRPDPAKEEILEFLRKPNNAGKQMTAKEIAQAMGFQGGRNVNKQLYGQLLKQKLVVNDERVDPPLWWLPDSSPVNPPRQVLSGASPRGRSSESEILYKRTDTRDDTLPTTVEKLTTEHPKQQPSASDPAQPKSEIVCVHPPPPRPPIDYTDGVQQEQTELAELSSHVSSRLSDVDNISTVSQKMSQVSLQGCPDTQREDKSSEPSAQTPLVDPQHPVPKPRRQKPGDDERKTVLQRPINNPHSPFSFEKLSKQTGSLPSSPTPSSPSTMDTSSQDVAEFSPEAFMKRFKDAFSSCVAAKDIAVKLRDEDILSSPVKQKIDTTDPDTASRELFHHFRTQGTRASILKLCEVMLSTPGYPRMEQFAQRMKDDL